MPETAAGGHGFADPEPAADAKAQATEIELWRRIDDAGIKLMRIPTPFAVGRVNCWLIEDDPLTLIDAGPNSGTALDELVRQLRALGHRVDDIGLIVVSHQHIDHIGLVDVIARHSGAEVAAIDRLVPFLENYKEFAEADDVFAGELMLRHGIPEQVVVALRAVSAGFRGWGAGAKVDRVLRDGETLELGDRRLEVQLRPGHSPTDTLFWDSDRSLLIGADHLIKHISSNPLLARPLDGTDRRPHSLLVYLDSLARTRELPAEIVLPGHGEPVTEHAELIDSRFRMHRRRAAKLLRLIRDEPRTAHELAQELWGDVAVTQAYLTLSEIIGHLDMLIAEGRAAEVETEGIVRFAAIEGAEAPAVAE